MNNSDNREKIKIIYILSTGRSGSTILDMLIGSSEKVWTLGEVLLLNFEVQKNETPCGCNEPVSQCEFWTPFILQNTQNGLLNRICKFRDSEGRGKLLRFKYLKFILGKKKLDLEKHKDYFSANKQLYTYAYKEANKIKETHYLVDCSKDLYRLLLLQSSGLFDIKVIHLTKSVSNFTYSLTKPDFGFLNTIRTSAKWLVQNYLMLKICNRFIEKSIHIKYVDLVKNPKSTIKSISEKLDLNLTLKNTNFRSQINHGIAGNMSRFKTDKIIVQFDYKEKLPKSKLTLSKIIASPIIKTLEY